MKANIQKLVSWVLQELMQIKKQLELLQPETAKISSDWISWKEVMKFFEYKDTQMAEMVMEHQLIVTKIGRRKFIKRSSVIELLEKNIVLPPENDTYLVSQQ